MDLLSLQNEKCICNQQKKPNIKEVGIKARTTLVQSTLVEFLLSYI